LPAGGGCKELVQRAALEAAGGSLFPLISQRFQAVSMGKMSQSAEEAKQLGYLRADDVIVFHPREILHVAKSEARALAERGYRPPAQRPIRVAGRTGIANLQTMLVNMREGGFISDHDVLVSTRIAEVLCGGDVEPGTEVSEAWLLGLERTAFVALAQTEKTRARIEHMLKAGKPLRN
jgi:3-hydroxyacyl-CoA dehydrogenase